MTNPPTPKSILILDDDADFRRLVLAYLGRQFKGARLVEYDPVSRGVPADDFDWSEYDVLILDYNLGTSGGTGLDILDKHRRRPDFPATIMLTGAGGEEVAVRALKFGVYDYLRKRELTKEGLHEAIREAFEKHAVVRDRRAFLEEARRVAREETEALIAGYRAGQDRQAAEEQARLKAGFDHLAEQQRELAARMAALQRIQKEVARARRTADERTKELKARQISPKPQPDVAKAAPDLKRTVWKSEREGEMHGRLEEDLAEFRETLELQEKALAGTVSLSDYSQRVREHQAARRRAERDREASMFADIGSQLGKGED